jgi:hypothetical protein
MQRCQMSVNLKNVKVCDSSPSVGNEVEKKRGKYKSEKNLLQ